MMKHLAFALALLWACAARAETTTGGVTWLDTLSYAKPQFYPLTVPTEASAPKYYVDQVAGSGTTCSEASPCATVCAVAGKTGTTGGPAYIYLKGNARLNINCSLFGSAGNEIVIKPWPGETTVVRMATTGGGNVSNANLIGVPGAPTTVQHVIVDGGPLLLFEFYGTTVGGGNPGDLGGNSYVVILAGNYLTLARSRVQNPGGYGPAIGVGTGGSGSSGSPAHYTNLRVINNEVFDSKRGGTPYGVYAGGGTSCGAGDTRLSNSEFRNNIFRDICGRGIMIEPRHGSASSQFHLIDGNAFRDVGKGACWGAGVSAPAQPADSCGGNIDDITITNNLMFDLGGGGITLVGSFSNTVVANNTIYDYAKGTPLSTSSHGISCFSDGCPGVVKNNIILKSNGGGAINAINRASGLTLNQNLCDASGCDVSGTVANTFESTSTASSLFLRLKAGSTAIANGETLAAITRDYLGNSRAAPYDIGAMNFATSLVLPAPMLDKFRPR